MKSYNKKIICKNFCLKIFQSEMFDMFINVMTCMKYGHLNADEIYFRLK